MPPIPTLESPRLILRPFAPADAKEVQRLAGDRDIAEMTTTIPHPYEDGLAEAWIAKHQETFDQGTGVTFAVTRKADGALLGAISLLGIAPGHQAELGYWIGKPYWGQGLCTEAARAVVGYAFGALGLIRVHARHISRNPASGRVMKKIGMKHEGCRRRHAMRWGRFDDMEMYGILQAEWEEAKRSPKPAA